MSKKKRALQLWKWIIPVLLLLLPVRIEAHFMINICNILDYDLLTESGRNAYADCQNEPVRHNTLQHLADTAWNKCKNLFGEAQCNSARATVDTTVETGRQTGQSVLNCVSDPLGCAQDVIDNLGLTDPNLGKMAILTGNIRFETGGLLFSDFGLTTIDISNIDDTKVSDACKAFIALWDRTLEDDLLTVTTGGPYRIVVPACGSITYTIKPTNSLFTWNPPTHNVTVGVSNAVSSSGENSEAGAINAGILQQQQTETTGEFSGEVTQEQSTGKSSNSGAQQQQQEQQQNSQERKSQQQINESKDKPKQQKEESTQDKNSNKKNLRILRKK